MVKDHAPLFGGFLQSWEWGEFQKHIGREVKRIDHVSEGGRVIAQAVKLKLPVGQYYWNIPKGPLGKSSIEKKVEVLREELPGAMFLRMEPEESPNLLQVKDVQPSTTLMLDLTKDEDQLLSEMKSKTRYNIRLAQRKNVQSRIVGLKRFDDFVRLMKQTTTRDNFRSFPESYYRNMLEVLRSGEVKASLAMAFYDKRPLVANIMIDFDDTRTYLHGASSNLHRNVMAPYALHWYLIQDAKKKGFKKFDFWGVAPEDAPDDHPWRGVTRYKAGYGGEVVSMPGTFDLPIKHMWYETYKIAKKVRSIKSR